MMEEYRRFLKTQLWEDIFSSGKNPITDQRKGVPHPPLQKTYPKEAKQIDLVSPEEFTVGKISIIEAIKGRKSRRRYSEEALTLEELSFLLWATQGVHRVVLNGVATIRTVPSAGARHPFETYLVVNRVEGLEPGLYRYLSLEHKMYQISKEGDRAEQLTEACMGQKFVGRSAATFVWTVIPYRTEWRYERVSHKLIALDAGHLCQNLYLACEAIKAGTCAIGAYSQEKMDELLGVDGKEEFTIYVAPVGKIE